MAVSISSGWVGTNPSMERNTTTCSPSSIGSGSTSTMMISPARKFLVQQPLRQWIFHESLDGSAQRPRSQRGVVAGDGEMVFGGVGEFQAHPLGGELVGGAHDHQVDDAAHLLWGEFVEHDHFVDAVEELGPGNAF